MLLEEFQRKCCLAFMKNIIELKLNHSAYDFRNILANLQHSFLVLINSFEIKMVPPIKWEIIENFWDLKEMKFTNLRLFIDDDIVIDIEETYSELAKLFVTKSIGESKELVNMVFDYDTRCCDYCGLYFLKPYFETPIIRRKEDDFILALHEAYQDEI